MSDVTDLRAALSIALGAGYLIDRELDGAGFARVFVAREEAHDRDVAIKVLSPELSRFLSAERFETELRLGQWLQEAHTLPILATGRVANGQLYYVMPFVRGETLRQRIEQGPVGFDESVGVLRDVARSMEYAHGRGLLHRNLKPENIIVANSRAVVTDFCLSAAILASRTRTPEEMQVAEGTTHGSPGYMAPEQLAGDTRTGFRADIYAWGVIAYEILLDIDQIEHLSSLEQITAADLSGVPPLMLYKRHGVPEQLAALVMRCLEEDPAARPANALELLTVLDRIPDGRLALALESENAARWVGASILLGLAIFCMTAWVVWKLQRRENRPVLVLAVLPFETSSAPADSLFADQLGDALTNKLARLPNLRVIDRASVLSLEKSGRTTHSMGTAVGADYMLRGTVCFVRDASGPARMEVIPVLYRISNGSVRWTGRAETVSPANPHATEALIATRVADELDVFMRQEDRQAMAVVPTTDSAALAHYTAANRRFQRTSDSSLASNADALRDFENAYRSDPGYSEAYGSAAMILLRAGLQGKQRSLIDSAATLARLAHKTGRTNPLGLVVSAHVALYHDHPDEAYALAQQAVAANPSSTAALQLRTMMQPLVGDSVAAWHDAELLAIIAPRNIDALLTSAATAQAYRRFADANGFLLRARVQQPQRLDLILRSAQLFRADGEYGNMTRAITLFRARGGQVSASELTMFRTGGSAMRRALETGSPADFNVRTRPDSFTYYFEKAQFLMSKGERAKARFLLDSSITMVHLVLEDSALRPMEKRHYIDLLAWAHAAIGERVKALAVATGKEHDPATLSFANGQYAATLACNTAEIYAMVDDVLAMLPQLRRCLTLPGGYWQNAIFTEPALMSQSGDPRARELFRELKLDVSH